MLPAWHALLGAIFAFLLATVTKIDIGSAFVIFLASVLIDIDHYAFYVLHKKNLGLRNAYNYYLSLLRKSKKNYSAFLEERKKILCAFHTIEFFLLVIAISFFNRLALLMLAGFSFHLFLDIIAGVGKKPTLMNFSIIDYLMKISAKSKLK